MFKLYQYGPTSSDCTAAYNVELNGDYTVETFVRDVLLDKREWGTIRIDSGNYFRPVAMCSYDHGEISKPFPEEFLKLKVVSAKANGGWSAMDYDLTVEIVRGETYQVTEHFRILEDNIYGDLKFVVLNENGERIAAFRNQQAAMNECRYLERLEAQT